jgi:nucleotide-binding universal stress UspA family protein
VGAAATGVETDIVVRSADDGRVGEALVAEAARDGALICLTSRGRSRVGKFVLGSVTAEILQIGVGPVLVIGPNYEPGGPIRGQRLVVCVDGSDFAEGVIPVATSWSATFDMPLWLVEVISPTSEAAAPLRMGDVMESAYVARVAKTLSADVNWDVLHSDSPAEGIVDLASAWPVGILALATHGRTGWSRVTTGSVALSVVRDATRPVLLVRLG